MCDCTLKEKSQQHSQIKKSTILRGFYEDHINAITHVTNYKYAYEH